MISSENNVVVDKVTGWSGDNVAFGMGGKLLQGLDRDTQKFALTCSAIRVNGEWQNVYKDPATDPGKASKAGILSLYQVGHGNPNFQTFSEEQINALPSEKRMHVADVMCPVYRNGNLLREFTMDEVRERANSFL